MQKFLIRDSSTNSSLLKLDYIEIYGTKLFITIGLTEVAASATTCLVFDIYLLLAPNL